MWENEDGKRSMLLKLLVLLICMIQFSEATQLNRMSLPSDHPGNATVVRFKRYLDFLPKSRMFFRGSVKTNALSINQILAFSYGYRANYPIENDRKIRRRDVNDSMEEMIGQIPNNDDGTYSEFRQSDCSSVSNNCPLNLLNLTPYMDL